MHVACRDNKITEFGIPVLQMTNVGPRHEHHVSVLYSVCSTDSYINAFIKKTRDYYTSEEHVLGICFLSHSTKIRPSRGMSVF